jgi:hypothetical protein
MLSACVSSVPLATPGSKPSRGAGVRRDELFGRARGRVECVDLAAQRLELGERELARAAFGARRAPDVPVGVDLGGAKRLDAGRGERRDENVGRRR